VDTLIAQVAFLNSRQAVVPSARHYSKAPKRYSCLKGLYLHLEASIDIIGMQLDMIKHSNNFPFFNIQVAVVVLCTTGTTLMMIMCNHQSDRRIHRRIIATVFLGLCIS
jgi:hypothetical protein